MSQSLSFSEMNDVSTDSLEREEFRSWVVIVKSQSLRIQFMGYMRACSDLFLTMQTSTWPNTENKSSAIYSLVAGADLRTFFLRPPANIPNILQCR